MSEQLKVIYSAYLSYTTTPHRLTVRSLHRRRLLKTPNHAKPQRPPIQPSLALSDHALLPLPYFPFLHTILLLYALFLLFIFSHLHSCYFLLSGFSFLLCFPPSFLPFLHFSSFPHLSPFTFHLNPFFF